MAFFGDYLLFLAKFATVVSGLFVLAGMLSRATRGARSERGQLRIRHINRRYRHMAQTIEAASSPGKGLVTSLWRRRRQETPNTRRIFLLDFHGDVRASAVRSLREEITAIIAAKRPGDEVVLRLESLGGLVAAYGLAASQLRRLKVEQIPLTVCVDRVAASGGYLMAAVADHIYAAPFAIIGSIGVIAQLPNFHRLLKKHDIDLERFQAGPFKRTVTLFGENTDEGRAKLREQVEETYRLFKAFLARHRPQLDVDQVATGEYWYGERALEQALVDDLRTSDDYLLAASHEAEIYEVSYLEPTRRHWGMWQ